MTTAVIGAGIIGTTLAYALKKRGRDVVLIERDGPGKGASYGNMASIAVTEFMPASRPSVWKQIPGWMMDPEGPVRVRPAYMPKLTPWFLRFIAASRPSKLRALEAQGVSVRAYFHTYDDPPFQLTPTFPLGAFHSGDVPSQQEAMRAAIAVSIWAVIFKVASFSAGLKLRATNSWPRASPICASTSSTQRFQRGFNCGTPLSVWPKKSKLACTISESSNDAPLRTTDQASQSRHASSISSACSTVTLRVFAQCVRHHSGVCQQQKSHSQNRSSAAGMPATGATGTCSTAPAALFAAVGVPACSI